LIIFDPHTLQQRHYFDDQKINVEFETTLSLFVKEIKTSSKITIAFPDDGACKRFGTPLREMGFDGEFAICVKVRNGNHRKISVKEGDVRNEHVVIVDDIMQTGGTLLEANKVLRELGAAHVSAFVVHGVFPDNSYTKIQTEEENPVCGFLRFWVTDTIPSVYGKIKHREPFKILPINECIVDKILLE
jgi:phosphoribosylpyrophosphate synthetase